MSGLYQRSNIWWMRYSKDGKQVRKSCHTDNKSEAEHLLKKIFRPYLYYTSFECRVFSSEIFSFYKHEKCFLCGKKFEDWNDRSMLKHHYVVNKHGIGLPFCSDDCDYKWLYQYGKK